MAEKVERFSIEQANDNYCLKFDGVELPDVDGKVLEGQFELPNGSFLVVLTQDCPFEETMTVVLFGPDLQRRDQLVFGAMYASFVIEKCVAGEESEIRIHTDQAELKLVVLAESKKLVESMTAKLGGATAGENKLLWLSAVEDDRSDSD